MKRIRWGLIGVFALLLVGCAQWDLVKPGAVTVGDTIKIRPGIDWSRHTEGSKELWTVDGSGLNEVVFLMGIEKNQPIIGKSSEKKAAKFKEGMTSIEIAEAVQSSFVSGGMTDFKISNLRPYTFGGIKGFRFEFAYRTKSGLDMLGLAVGAIKDKKLNVIIYDAPRIHFFNTYKDEVEGILASAKFI